MVKKLKGIQLLATVNLMQIELITIFDCTYCITNMSTIINSRIILNFVFGNIELFKSEYQSFFYFFLNLQSV